MDDVVNYVQAMEYAMHHAEELPLCNRFLRDVHRVLIGDKGGCEKQPGEFRTSQNWLGGQGSNLRNARYIPPNVEDMQQALADWEKYIHGNDELDGLVKVALLHYQFETIHPFLDGNGRIGRMFIVLYLLQKQVLDMPLLYISLYLKVNRVEYYDRMMQVRQTGDFEQWIIFFLEALRVSANEAVATIMRLDELHKNTLALILTNIPKRKLTNAGRVFAYLEAHPIIEISKTSENLAMAYNSVARVVKEFETLEILRPIRKSGKATIFAYESYMDILATTGMD